MRKKNYSRNFFLIQFHILCANFRKIVLKIKKKCKIRDGPLNTVCHCFSSTHSSEIPRFLSIHTLHLSICQLQWPCTAGIFVSTQSLRARAASIHSLLHLTLGYYLSKQLLTYTPHIPEPVQNLQKLFISCFFSSDYTSHKLYTPLII